MTAAPTTARTTGPILIDLDEKTWTAQLDRAAAWFGNVLMAQATFRKLAEDTAAAIHEPHIRKYLGDLAETAKEHEQKAQELSRAIGRDPSSLRQTGGVVLAKVQEATGSVQGWAGGGHGNWLLLRQLLFANLDAMGAFSIAEQLGYALGLPEIADLAFPIVNAQSAQHLLIMEYMLEMGPVSILYHQEA